MKLIQILGLVLGGVLSTTSFAHYPYVAPMSYQSFNNHTAIVAGFYDNPFASEVAIKNFKFHYHTPAGVKIYIDDAAWAKTQTLSSYSLENKIDGTYRIRGEKQGAVNRFVLDGKKWKPLVAAKPDAAKVSDKVFYAANLKKNNTVKTVQSLEIVETFVSRRSTSNQVIHHLHDGFDVQFLTHPNAIQINQPVQFKILDDKQGVAKVAVEILAQTTDFNREQKVVQSLETDVHGLLNFKISEKGQYLLKLDYQQPFTQKGEQLKRYKYTLAFNVIA